MSVPTPGGSSRSIGQIDAMRLARTVAASDERRITSLSPDQQQMLVRVLDMAQTGQADDGSAVARTDYDRLMVKLRGGKKKPQSPKMLSVLKKAMPSVIDAGALRARAQAIIQDNWDSVAADLDAKLADAQPDQPATSASRARVLKAELKPLNEIGPDVPMDDNFKLLKQKLKEAYEGDEAEGVAGDPEILRRFASWYTEKNHPLGHLAVQELYEEKMKSLLDLLGSLDKAQDPEAAVAILRHTAQTDVRLAEKLCAKLGAADRAVVVEALAEHSSLSQIRNWDIRMEVSGQCVKLAEQVFSELPDASEMSTPQLVKELKTTFNPRVLREVASLAKEAGNEELATPLMRHSTSSSDIARELLKYIKDHNLTDPDKRDEYRKMLKAAIKRDPEAVLALRNLIFSKREPGFWNYSLPIDDVVEMDVLSNLLSLDPVFEHDLNPDTAPRSYAESQQSSRLEKVREICKKDVLAAVRLGASAYSRAAQEARSDDPLADQKRAISQHEGDAIARVLCVRVDSSLVYHLGLQEKMRAMIPEEAAKMIAQFTAKPGGLNVDECADYLLDNCSPEFIQGAWTAAKQLGQQELAKRLLPHISSTETNKAHRLEMTCANVALDKVRYYGRRDGGFQKNTAPVLAGALRAGMSRVLDEGASLGLDEQQRAELEGLLDGFSSELDQLGKFSELVGSEEPASETAAAVTKAIGKLEVGQSVSIPASTKGSLPHATFIRVTKQADGSFEVKHYNTGLGIERYHYKRKDGSGQVQTFVTYKNVSADKLLNPANWEPIMEEFTSIRELYQHVGKELCGVRKEGREKSSAYYEAPQKQGSCAYQTHMAGLRELLIRSAKTPEEGLALYKMVKAQVLRSYYQMGEGMMEPQTQAVMRAKIRTQGLDVKLSHQVVSNPDGMKQQVDQALAESSLSALRRAQLKGMVHRAFAIESSGLERYQVVRAVVKALTKSETPLSGNGVLSELVNARIARHGEQRSLLEEAFKYGMMHKEKGTEQFVSVLGYVTLNPFSSFHKQVLQMFVEEMPEPHEKIQALIEGYRKGAGSFLPAALDKRQGVREKLMRLGAWVCMRPLIAAYKKAGNKEMVRFIKSEIKQSTYTGPVYDVG